MLYCTILYHARREVEHYCLEGPRGPANGYNTTEVGVAVKELVLSCRNIYEQ